MTVAAEAGRLRPLRIPSLSYLIRGTTAGPRRGLQIGLGVIWLIDAGLQYQSYMFTKAFPEQVIAPTGQGSPEWISSPVSWAARLMEHHVLVFNALFATLQLAIALGILFPRRRVVQAALATSVVWALLLWWLGEGIGSLLAGPSSPLSGVPGAAIIYAVIALIAWPRSQERDDETRSLAASSILGSAVTTSIWIALWGLFVFEALRPSDRSPSSLHAMVIGMQDGEPSPLRAFDRFAARPLNHTGTEASLILAVLCVVIAASVVIPRITRPALVLAVVISLVAIWAVGENFGGIATGQATDPNTGPLLALLAVAYWPRGQRSGHLRFRRR